MQAGPTSNSITKLLGFSSVIGVVLVAWLGLFVTPQDAVQGNLVRLIYVHPALAWTMYTAFSITAVTSALYLYPRTRSRFWDLLAGASAEVGVVFCGLALFTGSIWGRPTWGVWWTWDARLTTTALLFALFIGYLALRRAPGDSASRAKRCAVAALIAIVDVPIVHLSVEWWRTLHQGRTLLRPDPTIHGSMLVTMVLSFVVMTLVFSWLTLHRFRLERIATQREDAELNEAVARRRAESSRAESMGVSS